MILGHQKDGLTLELGDKATHDISGFYSSIKMIFKPLKIAEGNQDI